MVRRKNVRAPVRVTLDDQWASGDLRAPIRVTRDDQWAPGDLSQPRSQASQTSQTSPSHRDHTGPDRRARHLSWGGGWRKLATSPGQTGPQRNARDHQWEHCRTAGAPCHSPGRCQGVRDSPALSPYGSHRYVSLPASQHPTPASRTVCRVPAQMSCPSILPPNPPNPPNPPPSSGTLSHPPPSSAGPRWTTAVPGHSVGYPEVCLADVVYSAMPWQGVSPAYHHLILSTVYVSWLGQMWWCQQLFKQRYRHIGFNLSIRYGLNTVLILAFVMVFLIEY